MEKHDFDIKLSDHFKLYVLLKDIHTFEKELTDNDVPFYSNVDEQTDTVDGIRYFLLDKDRPTIDKILTDSGIIAQTETISSYNHIDYKRFYNVRNLVAFIIALIVVLALIIEYLIDKYST